MKEVSCTTSNNVVIDGSENKPVIIDFGKSCKIVKARLRKPKVNIEKSMNKFPHIAPEILCSERQSIASDVFSFGYIWSFVYLKTLSSKFHQS